MVNQIMGRSRRVDRWAERLMPDRFLKKGGYAGNLPKKELRFDF